jgi:hypothetical protein
MFNDSNTNIKELSAQNLKNYIGSDNDIYPPVARSITHAIWYMGWQYFPVSPHIHYVQGIWLEFWKGSYVRYKVGDNDYCIAEILECLLDAQNGEPVFIARIYCSFKDIQGINKLCSFH